MDQGKMGPKLSNLANLSSNLKSSGLATWSTAIWICCPSCSCVILHCNRRCSQTENGRRQNFKRLGRALRMSISPNRQLSKVDFQISNGTRLSRISCRIAGLLKQKAGVSITSKSKQNGLDIPVQKGRVTSTHQRTNG